MRLRDLLRYRDFAVLWMASAQSQLGDQLARVALSVLVFDRTGSALATAATYALTYLPAVVGGILLTGLADRYPRRAVVVTCDLIRTVLFAIMAIPAVPLPAVCGLLVIAVLAGSPYQAAEPTLVADMFAGDRYVTAQGLRSATSQTAQLVGFAVGGVIVAAVGTHLALLVDAATFATSAAMLRIGLSRRGAAAPHARRSLAQIRAAVRVLAGDLRLRRLLALSWLNAFWIVPEGLAAPYAAHHGGGPTAVGVLLAASPVGSVVGVIVLTRWLPSRRRSSATAVLAFAAGLPLTVCALQPGVPVAALLWGLTGACTAYLVLVITEFVAIVPPQLRGQATGLASSGLLAAQGIGVLLGGAIAATMSTGTTIALAGTAGSLVAIPLALARRREVRTCVSR